MTRVETSVCVCVCEWCSPTLGNERIMTLRLSASHSCSSKWAPVAYEDHKFRSNFVRLPLFKHSNCISLSHTHAQTDTPNHALSISSMLRGSGRGGTPKLPLPLELRTPLELQGISTSFIATLMHLVENTVVDYNNSYLFYTLYLNIGGEKTQDTNKWNYKLKVH